MKNGLRKFYGFLITIILYTALLLTIVFRMPQLVVDLSVFALQSATGYCMVAGLFFASNVMEHFANKGKVETKLND